MHVQKVLLIILAGLIMIVNMNGAAVDSTKHKIAANADEICPLLVGQRIPAVTLKDFQGKDVYLLKAVSEKPTVLIFYRGGWCPFCNLHLNEIEKIQKDLLDLGYQIIAVGIDKWERLNASIEKDHLTYKLLSDNEAIASEEFGIAFKVDDQTVEQYKKYNMDLELSSGEKHHVLPVPSAFIIGTDGKIKFEYINPDYKVRIKGDMLLSVAKSLIK